MNKLLYNPFEPLTTARVFQLIQLQYFYLVVQRFHWVGLTAGSGFMATYYNDHEAAVIHQSNLVNYEGKLLDLRQETQRDKILALLTADSPYIVFISTLKDKGWAKKMEKAYAEKIRGFIRSAARIKADKDHGVDIDLTMKHGHVMAIIRSGEQKLEVPFYEIIK